MICEMCGYAISAKIQKRFHLLSCDAASDRYDLQDKPLPNGCPLLNLKQTTGPRTKHYLKSHPNNPLLVSDGRVYPAKKDVCTAMLCTKTEGVIEECDAANDEDCHDCWDKEVPDESN